VTGTRSAVAAGGEQQIAGLDLRQRNLRAVVLPFEGGAVGWSPGTDGSVLQVPAERTW
jgi:hypothetical protein